MMTKRSISFLRTSYEQQAQWAAAKGDWETWHASCRSIRTLDMVTEAFDRPGYIDPTDAIPFSPKEAEPTHA